MPCSIEPETIVSSFTPVKIKVMINIPDIDCVAFAFAKDEDHEMSIFTSQNALFL